MINKCTPKVSVVLPCYNGEKYLSDAIVSCINQTLEDWELIIVNDCSTDNTLEIAMKFASNDPRIKVINNESNLKLPASLNKGFAEARGQYFTWTSDDNIMRPSMLENLSRCLDEKKDISFVVSYYTIINEHGDITSTVKIPDNLNEVMLLNNYVGASFMYRCCVCEDIGGYDTNMFLVEDYEYWIRIWTKYKIEVLHIDLYLYRKHEQSLTNTRQQSIAVQLLKLRLMYLKHGELALKNKPFLLSKLYYRIADDLKGREKGQYIVKFSINNPLYFGLRYIFIHTPSRIFRKLRYER